MVHISHRQEGLRNSCIIVIVSTRYKARIWWAHYSLSGSLPSKKVFKTFKKKHRIQGYEYRSYILNVKNKIGINYFKIINGSSNHDNCTLVPAQSGGSNDIVRNE